MAVLAMTGCADRNEPLVNRGFERAAAQYECMYEATPYAMYPRTVNNSGETRLIGAEPLKTGANWTNGFYPGVLWQIYAHTEDPVWKARAEKVTRALECQKYQRHHHDIGFIMMSSFGKADLYSPSEYYKNVLICSADTQLERYSDTVGVIRSWDQWTSRDGSFTSHWPVIIDNLMNLDLLFTAWKLTGDEKYLRPALSHADRTMKNHMREDGSAFHLVSYDPETGEVDARMTSQGKADSSAWSRGQAWAVYGFTMCCRFTGEKKYLDTAVKAADFFIGHENLPEDSVPYWDFDAEGAPDEPRDASAAAVAASALLELKDYVDDAAKSQRYREAAVKMLTSLCSPQYMAEEGENNYFLLKHSVASVPHNSSVDKPETYADYYFLEALLRLKEDIER